MNDIICWWSGGVTSAVAGKLAIDLYGIDRCRFVMIDTKNEDDDTYRFKTDCEKWYNKEIEIISNKKYSCIQDVWIKYKSLNVAHGAVCSSELKRAVREEWQKKNNYKHQVFGFDINEPNRARALAINHPRTNPIFPLLFYGNSKRDSINIIQNTGIEIPQMYKLGFRNNNCFKTGCVQGGMGYWQKIQLEYPDKFNAMADMEHLLTKMRGKPVTMLKRQTKKTKESGNCFVFLRKHPEYPQVECLDDMPRCEVEPLFECNGLCGINDLSERTETELEINYEQTLF